MSDGWDTYRERYESYQSRYMELISDYKNLPKGIHGLNPTDSLEVDLQKAEEDLFQHTPLTTRIDPEGNILVGLTNRKRGLIYGCRLHSPNTTPMANYQLIPESDWAKFMGGIDDIDGRRFVPDGMMLDQDGVGSCASEGMSGTLMKCRVYDGQPPVKLNPWFAYHTVSGGSDQGSSLSDNVSFAQQTGVCSMSVYGRDGGWRPNPPPEAYEDAKKYRLQEVYTCNNWNEFVTALLLWGGVYFGYSGHAIWATKILDSTRFEYCNSWGEAWGDGGYGTLDKSKVMWGYGAYAFRTVTRS